MATFGEIVKTRFPAKVFMAGAVLEFRVEIVFSFWKDGSYTIFDTRVDSPGQREAQLPFWMKDALFKDKRFVDHMMKEIKIVDTTPEEFR